MQAAVEVGGHLVDRQAVEVAQGQGQAVYAAVSFGAGGALGALLSGLLWDMSARLGFVVAALAALAGWWIVRVAVRGPLVEAPGGARETMREQAR